VRDTVAELPGRIIALKNKSNFISPFSSPVSKLKNDRTLSENALQTLGGPNPFILKRKWIADEIYQYR
jgi:hypothetical protein